MRTSMKNVFVQFKVNLRYAKKRLCVVDGRDQNLNFLAVVLRNQGTE